MNRPTDSQTPPTKPRTNGMTAKKLYLILYNALSALLWAQILVRVVGLNVAGGDGSGSMVFERIGEVVKWVQTLAGLEVVHAGVGLVRAPLLTTLMQVSSRFLLVWLVVYPFPSHTAQASPSVYSSMLLAWSVTEVVRYSYFALNLAIGSVPGFLTWLRYNAFFVLYPLGISSECWLVWLATKPAAKRLPGAEWVLYGILGVYVPGSYILFTHMMAQRRKIMRAAKVEAGKKKA